MTIPRELRQAEAELSGLAAPLRRPLTGMAREPMVAIALGRRGWALYRGFRHALTGPNLTSAHVDLRAVLDVTLLARWVEEDPLLRVRLWFAEDDRQRIIANDVVATFQTRRGQAVRPVFSAVELEAFETEVASARAAGIEAGIVAKSGPLLPTQFEMAKTVDDLWELYNVGYRNLSATAHAGSRSFALDELVTRADGHLDVIERAPFDKVSLRYLAVPTVCALLATVSRQAGLGIEADCDRLRLRIALGPARPER